jgi:hypothetical protein
VDVASKGDAAAAALHCPHANVLGGGVCSGAVNKRKHTFCTEFKATCSKDGEAYSNCAASVAGLADGKTGAEAATEDSFGCREYHLGKGRDVWHLFSNRLKLISDFIHLIEG